MPTPEKTMECHLSLSPCSCIALQMRNYLMCLGLFVGVAALWAFAIYVALGASLFRARAKPRLGHMATQVGVCTRCLWAASRQFAFAWLSMLNSRTNKASRSISSQPIIQP